MTGPKRQMGLSSPTLHLTVLFSIAVFVSILVISIYFRIEVVARGKGRVVPISRVQVVQPEFSGRLNAINVRNGMFVRKGQVLIELDATDAKVQLATIASETDRLRIEMARIDAMTKVLEAASASKISPAEGIRLFNPPPALRGRPFTQEQRALLESEISDLQVKLKQIGLREEAVRKSEAVVRANSAGIEAVLAIQAERLNTARKLLSRGASSKSAFLDVEQAYVELERQKSVFEKELDQKATERQSLASERRRLITSLRSSLLGRKTEIDARLAKLEEEARAARRRLNASILRAPVSGIVNQLKVFTVGGVAKAGQELLRIVPSDVEIEIEGIFPNRDMGFLKVGQQANIRFEAYPSERYGFVKGRVTDIAADSTKDPVGQWGYIVRVAPKTRYLQAGKDRFPLRPGMTATIDVTTDKRRLITYFFAPVVRTIQDSMGER